LSIELELKELELLALAVDQIHRFEIS